MTKPEYDVIIVGAGAGGGVAAGVLAEAGKHVLLLDRGAAMGFADVGRDHLANHRLSQYGFNTEPLDTGRPRVLATTSGGGRIVHPHETSYGYNASVVGGGTLVYGAQAWRFLPDDFRMASKYGVPEGSSLADWPITYEDLEPFYDTIERELGVAATPHELGAPRQYDYPMPPPSLTLGGRTLSSGASLLGWRTGPVPLLINTVPHNGRPACIGCGRCVGFACPTDAKTGTQNTMIPRALATGRCTLVSHAAVRTLTSEAGVITGVEYVVGDVVKTARAKTVVLAAGAMETARLLLNSRTDREPHGVGNNTDQVGRHVQGHYYPSALGQFDDVVHDGIGPGPSISTIEFNHDNPGIIGGGMLADEFVKLPVIFQKTSLAPEAPRWGLAGKRYMRDNFLRTMQVQGPVQEIPSPTGRVTLDPDVRDSLGVPALRLSGAQHESTIDATLFMLDRAKEWLRASGAKKVWGWSPPLGLSHGQHQAGTCRMGSDPKTSVTDATARVHGHDNLFVADSSVHVTNGGFNPVLTIMSLAWRTATIIARDQ